jgi:hypothetical protein
MEIQLLNIECFFNESSFKRKLKIIGKLGHALDIVGKPLMSGI